MAQDEALACPECSADMQFQKPVGSGNRGEWDRSVTDLQYECTRCGYVGYVPAAGGSE